jgi:hypothetical protein
MSASLVLKLLLLLVFLLCLNTHHLIVFLKKNSYKPPAATFAQPSLLADDHDLRPTPVAEAGCVIRIQATRWASLTPPSVQSIILFTLWPT